MSAGEGEAKKKRKLKFRLKKQTAVEFGQQADEKIEKLLIRRFDRLISVRRFIIIWVGLFLLMFFATAAQFRALTPYYKELRPVPGGIYSEGIIGAFSNANPIYASSAADSAISHLVFSGLFKYDEKNNLVGDLAQKYELDKTQTLYTVHLKPNIKWHDGKRLTADDVVFTYHSIQDPESQSSLYTNWQGIKVSKVNDHVVTFKLPNSLSAFPHSLTNGIIPKHKFEDTSPVKMRSAPFNVSPVGTGPFEWKFVEVTGVNAEDRQQRISLSANPDYWAGKPKLDGFSLTTFSNEDKLLDAFGKKQLNAISGLASVPEDFNQDKSLRVYKTPITSGVMAFFNMSKPALGDVDVRKALISGVDREEIPAALGYSVNLLDSPLLPGQLGYNSGIVEDGYNLEAARKTLEDAGWTPGDNGFLTKGGKILELSLTSQDTPEYTKVAQFLQKEWRQLGVKVNVHYYGSDDLQTSIIANHDYDILLYGISIGVDPDVFAYWDSTQASTNSQTYLNLSEYKSKLADQALEAGRTRAEAKLRVGKYKIFLTNWVKDAPALALYQPNMFYVTRGPVFNYEREATNNSADRFYNVHQWMVRQRHQSL